MPSGCPLMSLRVLGWPRTSARTKGRVAIVSRDQASLIEESRWLGKAAGARLVGTVVGAACKLRTEHTMNTSG